MKAYHFIEYVKEMAKRQGLTIEKLVVTDSEGTSSHERIKEPKKKVFKPGPFSRGIKVQSRKTS